MQIVCALGALLYARDIEESLSDETAPGSFPGEAWAVAARNAVLSDLAALNLKRAMVSHA